MFHLKAIYKLDHHKFDWMTKGESDRGYESIARSSYVSIPFSLFLMTLSSIRIIRILEILKSENFKSDRIASFYLYRG